MSNMRVIAIFAFVTSEESVMTTLVHLFRLENDDVTMTERLVWARPHKLKDYNLAPAVEKIVARAFFRDPYFFEEFAEAW